MSHSSANPSSLGTNPSNICNNDASSLLGATSTSEYLYSLHHQYASTTPGGDHLVGGGDYFHPNSNPSSPPTLPAPNNSSASGLFSPSQFHTFSNNAASSSLLDSDLMHHNHSQSNRGTPAKRAMASGEQQHRHQYLEPVIITNSPSTSKHHHNQIHKYQPPPPIPSGYGGPDGRPSYTPGIYQVTVCISRNTKLYLDSHTWNANLLLHSNFQPSSCLRDTDEIYDYVPPRQTSKSLRQISPLSKR